MENTARFANRSWALIDNANWQTIKRPWRGLREMKNREALREMKAPMAVNAQHKNVNSQCNVKRQKREEWTFMSELLTTFYFVWAC